MGGINADVDTMIAAARDFTMRVRRCSHYVLSASDKLQLTAAAHAAGQMAMLARLAEQRLLAAIERKAGAQAIVDAVEETKKRL